MHDDTTYNTPSALKRFLLLQELAVSGLIAAKMAKRHRRVGGVSLRLGSFSLFYLPRLFIYLLSLAVLVVAIVRCVRSWCPQYMGLTMMGYLEVTLSIETAPPRRRPVFDDVTPTAAEVYRAQQEDREKGLTPVKPTPSYGTNSVFNQQAARPAPVQPAPAQPAYEQRAAAPPSRNLNFEYYCNNPKGVRMEHVQWCERLLRQQYYRGDYGYSGYYSGRRGY